MGEATVADIKGKGLSKLDKETKANTEDTNKNKITTSSDSRGKKSRRRQRKTMALPESSVVHPVQRLFDACKDVFAPAGTGFVPSPDKIEQISTLLDEIQPSDVGLTPQMPFFSLQATGRAPIITYLHIHECEKFSIGIFCLPPSGVLPLHNHPGMTVFSKLLLGTVHIKSYDWVVDGPTTPAAVDPSQTLQPEVRLAKVKVDSDMTAPCQPSILYPADGGNMHCFTAVTACAVLDVLVPPYSDCEGTVLTSQTTLSPDSQYQYQKKKRISSLGFKRGTNLRIWWWLELHTLVLKLWKTDPCPETPHHIVCNTPKEKHRILILVGGCCLMFRNFYFPCILFPSGPSGDMGTLVFFVYKMLGKLL